MTLIGKVNDDRIRSSLIIHDVVVCLDYTATRQLAASKSFWQHALHLHLSAIATSARLASEQARVGENEKDPDTTHESSSSSWHDCQDQSSVFLAACNMLSTEAAMTARVTTRLNTSTAHSSALNAGFGLYTRRQHHTGK